MTSADDLKTRFANSWPNNESQPPLSHSDDGGTFDGMSTRVTRLEEWARTADQRMGRVEDKLDTVIERLGRLPSRLDMLGYLIATVAAFLALTAVIVTSMGWLETRAARVSESATQPAPIVIEVPGTAAPQHR